jgi:hypothetical protein
MRCWQDGRLILEQSVKALPADATSRRSLRDARTGSDIVAFDFRNAFCLIR